MEERDPGFAPPPLPYAPPPPGRPALVTVVGVLSVLIGLLGGLGALSGIGSAIVNLVRPSSITTTTTYFSASATSSTTAPATAPTTALGVTSAATLPPAAPTARPLRITISRGARVLTLTDGCCSLLVSILLVAAGIAALRRAPSATRLHWLYVILKLPLAVVGSIAGSWMAAAVVQSAFAAGPAAMPFPGFVEAMVIFGMAVGFLLAIAYPIALIFLLRTRTWREYFASVQSGTVG